ncbi:MAG: hypothetical protein Q9184_006474 [Pyrenodesmia sp. 2 TL-2023]
MAANSHENVLLLPDEIERRHLNTTNELKADIGAMGIGLHDALRAFGQRAQESLAEQGHLKGLLDSQHLSHNENQIRIMNEIHAVRSSLSDINSHVRTDTTVSVPTEAAVARVIRAELRRVLKPTVEQCLNTFKANTDDQSRSMLQKIDEMAEHFGQEIFEASHSCSSNASHFRSDAAIDQQCAQDHTGATALLKSAQMDCGNFMLPERANGFLVRPSKHWRRSMVIKWAIGTLRVTVSSTRTTSNVSYVGEVSPPQTAYQITIEFQPAQFLITLRGLTLSLAHIQDQRGHCQVCPLLATFAIVPSDADVMIFAKLNDVAGLQSLFERRLAAPSDRDETGITPLMVAVSQGAADACRFLLAMGADPLITHDIGINLFDMAYLGFFVLHLLDRDISVAYDSYTSVLRPLQSLADDLEPRAFCPSHMSSVFLGEKSEANVSPKQIEIILQYLRFLKEWGLEVNRTTDKGEPPVHDLCTSLLLNDKRHTPMKRMEIALRITLELGGDISAFNSMGIRPLSYLFLLGKLVPDDHQSIIELATLLLKYGADPRDLDVDGASPFLTAELVGLGAEFLEVLEQSGFDVWKVTEETRRRQSMFHDGHGESTTVDNQDIAPPSTEGLSRRRVVIRERDED